MPLEEYARKRDFAKTPEPAGAPGTGEGRFVVQRHRATRLHYDVRLEIDGVLVSWAVPRGPTLDPSERRMAIHVEDHPIEYLDFEGVIPARQYGAGDVIVWDWGTWEPEAETPDPAAAIRDGELKFRLAGEKIAGRFTIVRTSGRPRKADRARGAKDSPRPGPSRATRASSGSSSRSATSTRSPGGTPRTTPGASRRAGPTTRSRPIATPTGSAMPRRRWPGSI